MWQAWRAAALRAAAQDETAAREATRSPLVAAGTEAGRVIVIIGDRGRMSGLADTSLRPLAAAREDAAAYAKAAQGARQYAIGLVVVEEVYPG